MTWIAVNERLPEKKGLYLTACGDGEFQRHVTYWKNSSWDHPCQEITHWMELPPPPVPPINGPGRKLDVLIADKVMGWERYEIGCRDGWIIRPNGHTISNIFPEDWKPSTEIKDAMRVVEKLRADGCYIWMAYRGTDWGVTFGKNGKSFLADVPTLPHAICLAALKTTEKPC